MAKIENILEQYKDILHLFGSRSRHAAKTLSLLPSEVKNNCLKSIQAKISAQRSSILSANQNDVRQAAKLKQTDAFLDRLTLNNQRLESALDGIGTIIEQPDPVGRVLKTFTTDSGLKIERVSTPIGVIGMIFEARPNVVIDAAALSIKSGNACILRSGSAALSTCKAIQQALIDGLNDAGVNPAAVQVIPIADRFVVEQMLKGLSGNIDVIVPRGGRSLVELVQREARVPVFAHLDGVCHVYIHHAASKKMAIEVLYNSKMRRTGICGAAETVLFDSALPKNMVHDVINFMIENGCSVFADAAICELESRAQPATESDWGKEYLGPYISARIVDSIDEAMTHISSYGSSHTETIITEDKKAADRFLREVDSAIVMHNASTQFADGGEFGMGGEIGISTGRFHARGPVGVEQLNCYKYRVHGQGQVRP